MNTALRLSAYGATVVLLGVGAFALGSAADVPTAHLRPVAATGDAATAPAGHDPGGGHTATSSDSTSSDSTPPDSTPPDSTSSDSTPSDSPPSAGEDATPGGLASTANGFTIVPVASTLPAATPTEIAFRIVGPDGVPVTAFDVAHEKQLHLIVVRSDTAGFQHVHPTLDADGTWRVPVTLASGGTYRAFADFAPTGGEPTTLGVDLFAAGEFAPIALEESRTSVLEGGYEVVLDGELTPGRSSEVSLTVTRDGVPVTDLQPYLGAYGHLVALRTGDLGYLHVHPDGAPGDGVTAAGPQVAFHAEVPSAGVYRLFLDFQHDGVVRTAEFTVATTGTAVPDGTPVPNGTTVPHEHVEGGDHP